jgi:regulator of sirC expression with transglutaminase-like and TPR domain
MMVLSLHRTAGPSLGDVRLVEHMFDSTLSQRERAKRQLPGNKEELGPMNETPRERLRVLAQTPGTELPLAEGALLIAAEEYPSLDVSHYLTGLDRLADEARLRVPSGVDPAAAIAALCEFLFKEAGFRGDRQHYEDPKSSYLNEVLDRRRGIPISLAVVHLEVGWRLHLPMFGVGMPAHFLVGCETRSEALYVDAFNGTVLTAAGCAHLFREMTGASAPFRREYLAPTPARYVLVRILRNLKGIFLRQEDLERTAAAAERILLLAPDLAEDVRDLGLIRYHQGKLVEARRLFEQYLQSVPRDADDRPAVERYLLQVRELLARLN